MVDDETKVCPKCGADWDAGDIYETLRKQDHYKDKSDEEVKKVAGNYGWTEETPKRFSHLTGVEIRGRYDGVSYWECPNCKTSWNRFTGEKEAIH